MKFHDVHLFCWYYRMSISGCCNISRNAYLICYKCSPIQSLSRALWHVYISMAFLSRKRSMNVNSHCEIGTDNRYTCISLNKRPNVVWVLIWFLLYKLFFPNWSEAMAAIFVKLVRKAKKKKNNNNKNYNNTTKQNKINKQSAHQIFEKNLLLVNFLWNP